MRGERSRGGKRRGNRRGCFFTNGVKGRKRRKNPKGDKGIKGKLLTRSKKKEIM